jgi:hypothetical protein
VIAEEVAIAVEAERAAAESRAAAVLDSQRKESEACVRCLRYLQGFAKAFLLSIRMAVRPRVSMVIGQYSQYLIGSAEGTGRNSYISKRAPPLQARHY